MANTGVNHRNFITALLRIDTVLFTITFMEYSLCSFVTIPINKASVNKAGK